MKSGNYCVFIREKTAPHTWLCGQLPSGMPTTQSGKPAQAARYDHETAKQVAQKWADWLVGCGYEKSAKQIRIRPAGGGFACDWRPIIAKGESNVAIAS